MKKATTKSAASISELFYKGKYKEVLSASVDAPSWKKAEEDLPFVIGALSFTGRMDEAQLLAAPLFKQKKKSLIIRARFFLGLGHTRLSNYQQAEALFLENLSESQSKKLEPQDLFFIYQGLSFYRYYCGEFSAARKASDVAFKAAFEADDLYGKVLSTDIRGHIFIQLGETAAGFELLDRAEKLGRRLENASLPVAIQISKMIYRAQLGFEPKKSLQDLKTAMATLAPEDNYSRASFMLELARQLTLRGQVQQAVSILDKASALIYAHQNRLQEATLNLRYAYVMYCSGDFSRGLSFIRAAKRTLHIEVDHMLEQEALSLEYKLLISLDMKDHADRIAKTLAAKTSEDSRFIQRRIMAREQSEGAVPLDVRQGADPLGDLLDNLKWDPDTALETLLEENYFGLLYDVLKIPRSSAALYLDLQPGLIISLDHGQVMANEGLTPLLRKILRALDQGTSSKEELITKVWGFKYEALRHDTVIYAAITSLRKLLGEKSAWLETVENGYRWNPEIQMIFHKSQSEPVTVAAKATEDFSDEASLNYRQIQILRYLAKDEFLDVQKCKKIFKVSDITASRDLSALTTSGHVARIGKGRATRYKLGSSQRG